MSRQGCLGPKLQQEVADVRDLRRSALSIGVPTTEWEVRSLAEKGRENWKWSVQRARGYREKGRTSLCGCVGRNLENAEDHSAVTQVGTWRSPAGLLSDS